MAPSWCLAVAEAIGGSCVCCLRPEPHGEGGVGRHEGAVGYQEGGPRPRPVSEGNPGRLVRVWAAAGGIGRGLPWPGSTLRGEARSPGEGLGCCGGGQGGAPFAQVDTQRGSQVAR